MKKINSAAGIFTPTLELLTNNPLEIKKKFQIENKYNLAFISYKTPL
jgi:hypothetical protein